MKSRSLTIVRGGEAGPSAGVADPPCNFRVTWRATDLFRLFLDHYTQIALFYLVLKENAPVDPQSV